MNKKQLWLGISLVIIALICLLLTGLYYYMSHTVLDGSPALYQRLNHRLAILGYVCIGFLVPGVILIVTWFLRNRYK